METQAVTEEAATAENFQIQKNRFDQIVKEDAELTAKYKENSTKYEEQSQKIMRHNFLIDEAQKKYQEYMKFAKEKFGAETPEDVLTFLEKAVKKNKEIVAEAENYYEKIQAELDRSKKIIAEMQEG